MKRNTKLLPYSYKTILKYLGKRGITSLAPDKIELAKLRERQIDFLTGDELKRILNAPKENDEKSLRDRAILEMLFSTGLRISELCSLPATLIWTVMKYPSAVKVKKVRVVFISDDAKTAIKNYLAKRKDLGGGLFCTSKV